MARSGTQYKLFDEPVHFKSGLIYRPNFITPDEEEFLLEFISQQRLRHATGGKEGEYTAQRRYKHFGWGFNDKSGELIPGPSLPRFLTRFSHRIEKWLDISRGRVVEALINEYTPGTPLGWHTDREQFEHIIGISLGSWARMRFRPTQKRGEYDPKQVISLEIEPRSAYIMQDEVRWKWQHSVAATRALRYSITFRTLPSEITLSKPS
ncbi:MAG: 2OG-Fe(II) oxygenase [Parcubacteria group bacterium]|nr:2OG-Fe(II) oxygenase [Parcubacteria group bacterium]